MVETLLWTKCKAVFLSPQIYWQQTFKKILSQAVRIIYFCLSCSLFPRVSDNEMVEELLKDIKQKSVTLDRIRHNPHLLCRSPAALCSGQFTLVCVCMCVFVHTVSSVVCVHSVECCQRVKAADSSRCSSLSVFSAHYHNM